MTATKPSMKNTFPTSFDRWACSTVVLKERTTRILLKKEMKMDSRGEDPDKTCFNCCSALHRKKRNKCGSMCFYIYIYFFIFLIYIRKFVFENCYTFSHNHFSILTLFKIIIGYVSPAKEIISLNYILLANYFLPRNSIKITCFSLSRVVIYWSWDILI